MARYLLIAGNCYYPQSGSSDWVSTFDSRENCESQILRETNNEYFTKGPRKGTIKKSKEILKLKMTGRTIDWYEIIDLEEIINIPANYEINII